MTLRPEIAELGEVLAKNAHDNWARLRIAEGWRYGPERNDMRKEHPSLLPYEQLPKLEKEYDRQITQETIKTLLVMGYTIEAQTGTHISSGRTVVALDRELANVLQLLSGPAQLDLALLRGLEQLGMAHLGFVDVLVIVVVLGDSERLRQRRVRDEQHASRESARAALRRDDPLPSCSPALSLFEAVRRLPRGAFLLLVNKEEKPIVELRLDPSFGRANTAVKRRSGFLF